jgi:phosphate transport system substrate-binding protein
MSRLGLTIASVVALPASAMAQESGTIPEPRPLVARYATATGRLLVGGGPEAALIASTMEDRLAARIVGPIGAVPLLTQGTILFAILPREMTPTESAAVRRFSGGFPLSVPVLQNLYVHVRRDKDGAVDARALPILTAMLSDDGQARLARVAPMYKPLTPQVLATGRTQLSALRGATYANGAPGYVLADNSLSIIGSDTLTTILPDILQAYARHVPDVSFSADLRGSSTAMPALTAGTSIFAPMGRELWQNDLEAFQQAKGYAPTRIRIAYASHGPRAEGKTPPAIYVNARNPLAGLSMDQVKRIFAAGAPGGDITDWSALAPRGDFKGAIHVFGAREDGGFANAMRQSKLDGLPLSARYQAMPSGRAIVQAVAADPLGIGYATWIDAGEAPENVRILPLSSKPGLPFVLPTNDASRHQWPISYFFNIYIDKQAGQRIDARTKGLLRFLLSDEGQRIIAGHGAEEDGYVPLNGSDLAVERKRVESL